MVEKDELMARARLLLICFVENLFADKLVVTWPSGF
jgi:hypothetical protein